MDVEAVVIIGLRSRQAIDECVGQIIVTLDLASLAVDVGIFLRRNCGFLVVDGVLAAIDQGLIVRLGCRNLTARELRADIGTFCIVGSMPVNFLYSSS